MILEEHPSALLAALGRRAALSPGQVGYRVRQDGAATGPQLAWAELAERVRVSAESLRAAAAPGARVALFLPPGLDNVVGFLACLAAGLVAVPIAPRPGVGGDAERLARHPVVRDAAASVALTAEGVIALPGLDRGEAAPPEVAFLQYTSGSTGAPKGIMVTHANLAANVAAISAGMGIGPADRALIWLPPYHDMGLIGGILVPLWAGIPVTLMPPQAFARRPLSWLTAIAQERATISGGPNFAYEACVSRIPAEQRAGLDLTCWQVAFLGSDPVRARTLARFAEAFAPAGFSSKAFYPCYGLAEATLFVTGGRRGDGAVTTRQAETAPLLVGAGHSADGHTVAVVDRESGAPVPDGGTGEIVVRGPSVTSGYWRNPEATAAAFSADGWLRTGDLGFLDGGELFVNGRSKDTVIVRGRNLFPEDIDEACLAADPGIVGAAAAFGVDTGSEEQLVVVAEVLRRADADELTPTLARLRAAVTASTGVQPSAVALVARGQLPRTTSGKVRRSAVRARYLGGGFTPLAEDRLPQLDLDQTALPALLTAEALAGLAPAERGTALTAALRGWVAGITAVAPSQVSGSGSLVEAGLDSLMFAQLQGDLAARLGVSLSLPELYEARSLEALAELIAGRPADRRSTAVPTPGVPEATPAQLGTWYLEQLHPGTSAHVLARALRLREPADEAALSGAVRLLAARHPALRLAFRETDGVLLAVPGPVEAISLSIVDASSDTEVADLLERTANVPFDLAAGPLLRTTLIRRGGESTLVLAVHHAAVDLWSVSLLFAEFGAAYQALAAGEQPQLPAAGDPFAFAAARQAELAGPRGAELRQWWSDTLGAEHPPTVLPADRSRRGPAALATGQVSGELAKAEDVRGLAATLGTSSYTVLLAALKAVLAGYGNDEQVVVGTPAAGRVDPGARTVVGFLANPLPLRTSVAGNPDFAELVGRTHHTVLAALDHQDLPFAAIVEAAGASRADGRNPLFSVLFVLHQPPPFAPAEVAAAALGLPGLALTLGESVLLPPTDAAVDLTVELACLDDRVVGLVKYATDLFDEATATELLAGYASTLSAALADPGRTLVDLTAADPAPAETSAPQRDSADIVTRIWQQAERTPDAVAVRQGAQVLSYQGLTTAATALAQRLHALGVGPETLVGVALPRTPQLLVAILAVLRAGGAYCPLEPSLPPARIAAILEDARPALVLATTGAVLPDTATVLLLDAEPEAGEPVGLPPAVVHQDQLAYVLFTSGSTGRPKGVELTHRGVAALADWAARTYTAAELSAVLAGTPLTFDLSVFELLVTLTAGGAVVLLEHTADLASTAKREQVTLINTVPSIAAELLVDAVPDSVRTVNLAGEPLPARLVADLTRDRPVRVVNLYGPTEDTTYSTVAEIDPQDDRMITIGRVLPGSTATVLGANGKPAGPGMPGELLLGGPKLARGYRHQPARTAERFVPAAGGTRRYRTGDLVRSRHDGELVYLGRGDRQVKVRGVRIELDEIEAVLAARPDVTEAAVGVHRAGTPAAALVAYVSGTAVPADLRAAAAAVLPPAMVPAHYVRLERLPRTSTGKLDRRALESIEVDQAPSGSGRAVTEAEQVVAAVWAEVLDLADPDPDADFFTEGGHSLLAMRLVARLESRTGVRVSLDRLFTRPTIAGLTKAIAESAPVPMVEPVAGNPLSHAQERFWLLHSVDPGSAAYHLPAELRLRGPLDLDRLDRALSRVVARHDSLRVSFPVRDGVPWQRVAPAEPIQLPVTEVADEAAAAALAGDLARRPFDLAEGPLWRVELLRLAADDHRLVFVAHHAICDGWSLTLLARDLGLAYESDQPLPGSGVSYVEWAAAHRARWADPASPELAWWRERLRDLPDLRLPYDRPRPAEPTRPAAVLRRALPADTAAAVQRLAGQEGATPFMAVAALVMGLLGLECGQDSFGIGFPVAARTGPQDQELFGCVANTVVLRADLTGQPAFREVLRRTRGEVLTALAHQDAPFAQVVREVGTAGALMATPLFQVMLSVQQDTLEVPLAGLRTELSTVDTGTAKFDLTLLVEPGADGGLAIAFDYDTALFDESTVDAIADRLMRLAEAVTVDPDAPLHGIELTSAADRDLLSAWGDGGPLPDLGAQRLHEAVLAQAARTPDRVALVAVDGAVSYGALADQVLRLASGLRALGVQAEDRVAICHERDARLVVAVLGVLAAGAAYVPLRLADPAERRAELLADAQVGLVLTDPETAQWLDTWDVPLATVPDAVAAAGPDLPEVHPDQLAYVLYTSGSTGRPKGVAVTHRGALARIAWSHGRFTDAELAGVLAGTSISFDFSLFELFAPLVRGGAVLLGENVLDLPSRPDRDRVTCVTAVPSALATLLDLDGWPEGVRVVGIGGEPLTPALAGRVWAKGPQRVLNLYGPTEDSFCSTWAELPRQVERITVGHPLAGSQLAVVGQGGAPVPPGVPGEVVCRGIGVARGYHGRPGRTAAAFEPDPEGPPGARRYRSGDRARWTAAGLELLGRLDGQVKIRGHRVEIGEVEAAIAALPGIAETAVVLRATASGQPGLTAYLLSGGSEVEVSEVRAALRRRLPDYMVPAAFVVLEAFPRTGTGKLDRAALASRPDRPAGAEDREPPREGTEAELAGLWRDLLGAAQVGRQDRFFDLGGDSLLATRMATRVNDRFAVALPVRRIFEDDRLLAVARVVDQARRPDQAG